MEWKISRPRDPRIFQITILSLLIAYGSLALDLGIRLDIAAVIIATALLTQALCTHLWYLPRLDLRSPLISSLSLTLLLRTNDPGIAAVAAMITIASKFAIRANGKHIFNPTNFGLVVMMFATNAAWVSPGQWGSAAWVAFFFACLGFVVVNRAARSDVTWSFLVFYAAIVFGRSLYLGEPLAIPAHRLQNGAFLLFTFFMISDPKTTPDARPGRMLFALIVAAVAAYIRFGLYTPNGLIYALILCAPIVPLIDRLIPGERYEWPIFRSTSRNTTRGVPREQGEIHANPTPALHRGVRAGA
jgi:Na+-transporting NADH:ubiquinone oxidoreductase subunit NqrB